MAEEPPGAGAEDAGRGLEPRVDLLDERDHDQDDERHGRDEVGQDHAPHRAGEPGPVEDGGERDAVGDGRDQERQQEQQHDRALAREVAPRHGVGRRDPDQARHRDHGQHDLEGDDQHVAELELVPGREVPARRPAGRQPGAEPAGGEGAGDDGGDQRQQVEDEEAHERPDEETQARALGEVSGGKGLALPAAGRPAVDEGAAGEDQDHDAELDQGHHHGDRRGQRLVVLLEGGLVGGDRDHPGRPGGSTEQHRRGEDREGLDEGQAERDGEAGQQQRHEDVAEAGAGVGPEDGGGLLERRVDAGDVGEGEEEGEGEAGDDEGEEDAPVVVDEADRRVDQAQRDQRAVEPALRAQIVEQPFGHQHGAERHRQDEDGGQQALAAHQADAERHRDGEDEVQHRDRDGEPERGRDRAVEERVGEEALVVGQRPALLGGEREGEAVEERVDEEADDQGDRRQDQERDAVQAARGEALAEPGAGGGRGGQGARAHDPSPKLIEQLPRVPQVRRV